MRFRLTDERDIIEPVLRVLPVAWQAVAASACEPIWQPALTSSGGVYRLHLNRHGEGESGPQTCVVKVVDESAPGRREADLYASGALRHLRHPMTTALCHGVVPLAGGWTAIVLEDLQDRFLGRWPVSAYVRVSRILGTFAASPSPVLESAAHAVPPRDLLARDTVFVEAVKSMVALTGHAEVTDVFPPASIDRLIWLASAGRARLRMRGAGPFVPCHGDVQRRNLVALEDGHVAFLDWANLATGPLGQDVATLAYYASAWADLQIDDLNDFLHQLIGAYLQGLADAGWTRDVGAVWRSTYGQLVIGLGILEAVNTMRMLIDPVRAQSTANRIGQPIALLIERRQWLTHELLNLADRLLPELDRTRD